MRRSSAIAALVIVMLAATTFSGVAVPPVAAAEYALATTAAYEVRPDRGEIGVTVGMTFTNTTPDPPGEFSVFPQIELAIHDQAAGVNASDADGDLSVSVAVANNVNVATIVLREGLRFEESVEVNLRYTLADGASPQLRVRPSLVVFPAWSFGTASEVSVGVPAGYEVRIDGDALSESAGRLVSGPITDPGAWLALVIATRPPQFTTFEATVPLTGGTADLHVRSFADDEAWGQRTIELVERALPLLEDEIGLPYPKVGALVLTEAVAGDASGFGETGGAGTEILVAYDQPPFTVLHQVAHVWLSSGLIEARWVREGLATAVAARVAAELDVAPPFDPAAEVTARATMAFLLDAWDASIDPAAEGYGYAASWSFVAGLDAAAMRTVLVRVAASVGPYADGELNAETVPAAGIAPQALLTSRSFLDHLEAVTGADLAPGFGERILGPEDRALLVPRAEARTAFAALVAAADGWGSPDLVRAAMTEWRFDDARGQIDAASSWLEARDALLDDMEAVGLSAPERLRQAYRSYGGGAEAQAELNAQRAVVDAYGATTADVNAERTFLERIGLIGGLDPGQQLTVANGRFADGDLRGAVEAIGEAQRIGASAETAGIVRLASAGLVAPILAALAVLLFRRRASYTAAP